MIMKSNDELTEQKKFLEEMIELIAKHGKWTCNDHMTCQTCPYFNNPCDGSYNSTDPLVDKRRKMRYESDMERRSRSIRDKKIEWLDKGDFFEYLREYDWKDIVDSVYDAERILEHLPVEDIVKSRVKTAKNPDMLGHIIDDITRIENIPIHNIQREIVFPFHIS